jgi:ABC-type Mn2+/Zn2+ transport system ATPase subunit
MIQRLYVHNFRCLENFELSLDGLSSGLLIGTNGVGKSTVSAALEVLQKLGRGETRVKNLIDPADFTRGRTEVPMRFELQVQLDGRVYVYSLALEFPEGFKGARIAEETLTVDGDVVFSREIAQVKLGTDTKNQVQFLVDWYLAALPLIQVRNDSDPIAVFRSWLAHSVILSPVPSLMNGYSEDETLCPNRDASNFGDWLAGILSRYPAAYTEISDYLKALIPDINDFRNDLRGKDAKKTLVRFSGKQEMLQVPFEALSDGEKCFFVCAAVAAANKYYGPLFCFWDEPDSHMSLSEVSHFIFHLRRTFKSGGQILMTSHSESAIRAFSDESTFLLHRKSHLEPTLVRRLADMSFNRDENLVEMLRLGELEP